MGNEPTDVPVEAVKTIDPNVVAKGQSMRRWSNLLTRCAAELPEGTRVTQIAAHGVSLWARTARLDAELENLPRQYFLKTSYGDRGRGMMLGEFTSMLAISNATPDLVPRPIAWGTYASIPDVHFFVCDFHKTTGELPDIDVFPAKIAEMHRKGISPNEKYGFPVTTYHGNTPLYHGWADTWEEYFTTRTKKLLVLEQASQGENEELQALTAPFFDKVVPRLLRPLETGGRVIKPRLIHGDLWYGNATVDVETGHPIIFDAGSYYAHNEYDLGVWHATWNKFSSYITRYHKNFPISPPEEDFDDRNALYAMRVDILDSILYKGEKGYREKLISEMKRLVGKFPDGYEGWQEAQEQPHQMS